MRFLDLLSWPPSQIPPYFSTYFPPHLPWFYLPTCFEEAVASVVFYNWIFLWWKFCPFMVLGEYAEHSRLLLTFRGNVYQWIWPEKKKLQYYYLIYNSQKLCLLLTFRGNFYQWIWPEKKKLQYWYLHYNSQKRNDSLCVLFLLAERIKKVPGLG